MPGLKQRIEKIPRLTDEQTVIAGLIFHELDKTKGVIKELKGDLKPWTNKAIDRVLKALDSEEGKE